MAKLPKNQQVAETKRITILMCGPQDHRRLEYHFHPDLFPGLKPGHFKKTDKGTLRHEPVRDLNLNEPAGDEKAEQQAIKFVEALWELPGISDDSVWIESYGFIVDWVDGDLAPAEIDLGVIRLIAKTAGVELAQVFLRIQGPDGEEDFGSYNKAEHFATIYAGPVRRGEKTPEEAESQLVVMF